MGQRLLVVDSDRRFIQDHQAALEATFEVEILNTTEGALSRLESGQFAAVLLCVEVSENKGYSLCSAIRKSPGAQGTKVALISGKATEEEYARHQSLKGRADLYLHKPIQSAALVSALSPFVPMRLVDPDNPLGDFGALDSGDEWLDSLRTELELEVQPRAAAAPEPEEPAEAPLALAHQATQKLPKFPKNDGHVELLEARIQDLEAKLVAKSDDLDQHQEELADLRSRHDSVTRNLDDLEQRQAENELAQVRLQETQQAMNALEAKVRDLEAELETRTAELAQKTQEGAELHQGHEALAGQLNELQLRQTEGDLLQNRLQEAEQALDTQASRLKEVEAQLATCTAELDARSSALERKDRDLAELGERHDTVVRDLETCRQEQGETGLALGKLQEAHEDLGTQLAQREETLADLTLAQGQLQESHQALEAQCLQAQDAASALQQEVAEQKLSYGKLQKALQALEAQAAQSESRATSQETALAAALAEQQRLREEAEATTIRLHEERQRIMDGMEANQLLQAQVEEARENAIQHLQTERILQEAQEQLGQLERRLEAMGAEARELQGRNETQAAEVLRLEAVCEDCRSMRERLEGAFAELEQQVVTMGTNHERQQLELLAGIDEREAHLGRLSATIDAQQERLQGLEQQKTDLERQALVHFDRMLALCEVMADFEGKAHQALELAKAPTE